MNQRTNVVPVCVIILGIEAHFGTHKLLANELR